MEVATITEQRYRAISAALRQAGTAASFVAIALAIVEGSIAVYDYAVGKDDVLEFVRKAGKIGVAGVSAFYVSVAVAKTVAGAGASGFIPAAVAIVTAYGTYLVVDWAVDKTVDSLSTAMLTAEDLRIFASQGIPSLPQAHGSRGM
jgi:hypothetical protein